MATKKKAAKKAATKTTKPREKKTTPLTELKPEMLSGEPLTTSADTHTPNGEAHHDANKGEQEPVQPGATPDPLFEPEQTQEQIQQQEETTQPGEQEQPPAQPPVNNDLDAPADKDIDEWDAQIPELTNLQPLPDPEPEVKSKWKPEKRNALIGMFTGEEMEYIDQQIEHRKAAGLTKDNNHFIRQCVCFAINWQPGWTFKRLNIPRKIFE